MKKIFLIIALIMAMAITVFAEMGNVTSDWVDGNLVFRDVNKDIIFTIDATNRKMSFPTGSLLSTSGTTITLRDISYTLPSNNGDASQFLQTDGAGVLSWAAGTASVTFDAIGDAGADGTIALAGWKQTLTSTLNSAGANLTLTNTTADLTANTSFMDLKYTDDGDANGFFLRAYDNAGGDLKFQVGPDGAVTIAGTAEGTNALSITGGDITLTDGDVILSSGDLSVTGNFTLTGSFYQSAIAAAAAGNVNLTVDAAGNGTITIGGTSTGATIFPGLTQVNGNMDIGNAATDTLTITSIIDSNVTLDDGVTDSPSLILKDATDETGTFKKVDGSHVTFTPNAATQHFQILTGNLAVGNGAPGTVAMDGEDFYVNGDAEFDGAVQFDGLITSAAGATVTGAAVNLNVSSNFAVNIGTGTTNAQVTIGAGTAPFAVNSTAFDVTNTGAVSGVTTLSMTDDLSLANGKAIKGSTTDGETIKLQAYDNNTGPAYVDAVTITNGNAPAISIGGNAVTVAIDSTDWDITATGDITGIGAITADGLITGSLGLTITGATASINASSNFVTNIGTGTTNATVTLGGNSNAVNVNSSTWDVTAGAFSGVVSMTGDGTGALGGFLETVTDDVNGKVLAANESGTTQTNAGAVGAAAWTLPAAAVGLNYCFVVMAAQELRVTPVGDDVININGTAADAAEYWTANAAGETLCIVAVDATNWIAKSYTGTWTQQTP